MVVLRHHWQPTRNRHGRPKVLGGVGLERRLGTHLDLGVLGSRETARGRARHPLGKPQRKWHGPSYDSFVTFRIFKASS